MRTSFPTPTSRDASGAAAKRSFECRSIATSTGRSSDLTSGATTTVSTDASTRPSTRRGGALSPWQRLLLGIAPALLAGVLASCAQPNPYRDGQQFVANGKINEGLAKLEQANKQDPEDAIYRSTFIAEKEKALVNFDEQGDRLAAAGSRDAARKMYEQALVIEPNNERAIAGI
ncbi:MAG TPA: hypothetical protein VL424_18465, partial [Pararobbsia sp.]|nr:hypothetical protein [Pararobbsia sp.]